MPDQLPNFGETWTNSRGAGVDGIVALINGNLVTLVSQTGMWATVTFDRSYNPWTFKLPLPSYTQACAHVRYDGCRCHWPAFLAYERNPRADKEVVCPRHVPRGVHSRVITTPVTDKTFEGQLCSQCQPKLVDAIEVFGEVSGQRARMWTCPYCGDWWVHAIVDDSIEIAQKSGLVKALAARYTIIRTMTLAHRPEARQTSLNIYVKPKHNTRLAGQAPLTLYDHLLLEDDEHFA